MKLSCIKIISHANWLMPLYFTDWVKYPNLETKIFLDKLLNDPYFQEEAKRIRNKYQIPVNGFPIEKLNSSIEENMDDVSIVKRAKTDPRYPDLYTLYDLMVSDLRKLCNHYHLDLNFELSFFYLIVSNVFPQIEENYKNIMISSDKKQVNEWFKSRNDRGAAVLISNKITKEELHKWIDDKWDNQKYNSLKDLINFLPESIKKTKYKNYDIAKEIFDLNNKGKRIDEIINILSVKYQEDDRLSDKEWIKVTLSRYKKMINISKK